MNFNQLLEAVRGNPDAVSIPPSWAQGRAAFGGLMAAMVYEAMRLKLSDSALCARWPSALLRLRQQMCQFVSRWRCCVKARRSAPCSAAPFRMARW